MRFLTKPTVLVRQYDQIKSLLNSEEDTVEVSWPAATRVLLGEQSVTFSTGAYHRSLRRLLGPCFSPQAIETYLPAIQSICERYCAQWASATAAAAAAPAAATAASPADGAARLSRLPKLQKDARMLTFEVMSQVVAGFRFSPQQLVQLSDAFDVFTRGIFAPVALPIPGSAYARACAARKVMVGALDTQLDALTTTTTTTTTTTATTATTATTNAKAAPTAAATDKGGSVMERLLGMVDDEGRPLSRVALQELAINLLFAGHETTATSIVRVMLRLRSLPEVTARLRAEQQAAEATHGSHITGAALRDMPYLDAVVKEAWRADPIVAMVPRRARRDFTLAGYDVPKGWGLVLGLVEPQREAAAAAWPGLAPDHPMHPATFNPDRWQLPAARGGVSENGEGSNGSGGSGGPNSGGSDGNNSSDGSGSSKGIGSSSDGNGELPLLSSPIGLLPPQMMTFGGGGRYCLGSNLAWAELKVFLAVLVRRYDFSSPLAALRVTDFPVLTVDHGFPIEVRPHGEPQQQTVAAA